MYIDITDYMPKTTIDYKTTFGSNFLLGKVVNIDLVNKRVTVNVAASTSTKVTTTALNTVVTTKSNTSHDIVKYTDLVIAVGSVGPFPGKVFAQKADEAAAKYKELGEEVSERYFALYLA